MIAYHGKQAGESARAAAESAFWAARSVEEPADAVQSKFYADLRDELIELLMAAPVVVDAVTGGAK